VKLVARRDCPTDQQIACLVDPSSGGLPERDTATILQHLRRCPFCFRLVVRLRDQLGLPMFRI